MYFYVDILYCIDNLQRRTNIRRITVEEFSPPTPEPVFPQLTYVEPSHDMEKTPDHWFQQITYDHPNNQNTDKESGHWYGFISAGDKPERKPNQLDYTDLWEAFIQRTTAHGVGQVPNARGLNSHIVYNYD